MITAADVVVVGSGAFGASVAYHLARRGVRVGVLERSGLASQTSPRAAGLSSQVRATQQLTKLAQRAVTKLAAFTEETGQPLRFTQSGALKIARTERDAEQLAREVARGGAAGVPIDFISVAEAWRRLPILGERGIVAITWSPTDCNVEPSELPIGYCRAAEKLGTVLLPHTPATGFEIGPRGVEGVQTVRGRIATRVVVDAAGAWARLVAAGLGGPLPVVPTRHQLLITEPIAGVTPEFPIARVIDANVYVRHERGGLMLGGYEPDPMQIDAAALPPSFDVAELPLDIDVLWRLARSVSEQFPIFQDPTLRVAEHRGGLPTMTVDDRYLAGPLPGVAGAWVLSGEASGSSTARPGSTSPRSPPRASRATTSTRSSCASAAGARTPRTTVRPRSVDSRRGSPHHAGSSRSTEEISTTITVYGAGAIGGVTGAALVQAGHDVVLVDRAVDHVTAMNAHGLTIDRCTGSSTTPVRAITPDGLGSGLELVLLAVKSHDTPAALEVLAPRLATDGAIVSLQNGLNEELIAAAVGARRTVGCLVNWAADWTGPGRILHGGEGALVLGELDGRTTARVQSLAKLLDVVAPTRVTDNILGYTWAKHVYGALLVATAVVDAHVYEVVERSPDVQAMLVRLVVENMDVADASGIKLQPFDEYDPADYRAAVHGDAAARQRAMGIIATHYRAHTKTKTGIWRDLAVRRRKTEVGALLGATVAKARPLGIAMPLTERLIAMIEDLETGRRVMSWANVDELVSVR